MTVPSQSLALRPVPHRLSLGIETLFPFLVIVQAFADERREQRDVHQEPVDEIGGEAQRLHEIDEQHDARLVGMVPGFMLIRIVEDENLAFAPMADLVLHPDRDLVAGLGHDETEMEPEHAIIGTAMGGEMLAWLEDRKHYGLEPRDGLD